jgi:hypothetical protein
LVTWRCRRTSQGIDSFPEKGFSQPTMFGDTPPVTISPTPPRARSAK